MWEDRLAQRFCTPCLQDWQCGTLSWREHVELCARDRVVCSERVSGSNGTYGPRLRTQDREPGIKPPQLTRTQCGQVESSTGRPICRDLEPQTNLFPMVNAKARAGAQVLPALRILLYVSIFSLHYSSCEPWYVCRTIEAREQEMPLHMRSSTQATPQILVAAGAETFIFAARHARLLIDSGPPCASASRLLIVSQRAPKPKEPLWLCQP